MKIIFMGTPDFAVASLDALVDAGHEILAVITQPDRPKGRGNKLSAPPVKERAQALGISVYQPQSVKDEAFYELLQGYKPEVIIVAAYGRILPQKVLDLPKWGAINVHGSLLPKYRGAAPIQWAILNGDKETGVSIMQMNAGMDTGDILAMKTIAIADEDTSGTLFDKLALLGGSLLTETLTKLERGEITPMEQDDKKASYAPMLDKDSELIQWSMAAERIHNQVRGLHPAPGAYTFWNHERLKIWQSKVVSGNANAPVGAVLAIEGESIIVNCQKDALQVFTLQPAGKKMMTAKAFANGQGLAVGSLLG